MATEDDWLPWIGAQDWAEAQTPAGSVVVLSAHPDDEVLGVGAWLADRTHADLTIAVATRGEASHPASPTHPPAALVALRAIELRDAVEALGLGDPTILQLGLPDSGLADARDELVACVEKVTAGADLVVAPLRVDGHIDHDTLGTVAAQVCEGRTPLWEYPIWAWEWTEPADPAIPWSRAALLPVSETARRRKQAAIARFTTQVRPLSDHEDDAVLLEPAMLAHFDRPFEVVFR